MLLRLELKDGVVKVLREVDLLEPALVLVVEGQGLVNDPELLQEPGNLNQDDDGVFLDVLDQVLDEDGGLDSLAFNLKRNTSFVIVWKALVFLERGIYSDLSPP